MSARAARVAIAATAAAARPGSRAPTVATTAAGRVRVLANRTRPDPVSSSPLTWFVWYTAFDSLADPNKRIVNSWIRGPADDDDAGGDDGDEDDGDGGDDDWD